MLADTASPWARNKLLILFKPLIWVPLQELRACDNICSFLFIQLELYPVALLKGGGVKSVAVIII